MLAVAKLLPKNGERRFYSRSPADPLSEGVLLPPTGIEVSTAIISARMSSTGCGLLATHYMHTMRVALTLGTVLS
jgi:hypothetical protein